MSEARPNVPRIHQALRWKDVSADYHGVKRLQYQNQRHLTQSFVPQLAKYPAGEPVWVVEAPVASAERTQGRDIDAALSPRLNVAMYVHRVTTPKSPPEA